MIESIDSILQKGLKSINTSLDKHRNRNRDYVLEHSENEVLNIARKLLFTEDELRQVTDNMIFDDERDYYEETIFEGDLDF